MSHSSGGDRGITEGCVVAEGKQAGQTLESDKLGEELAWVRWGGQGRLLCKGDVIFEQSEY